MKASVMHLRFTDRDPSLSPTDERGSLQQIRSDVAAGLTVPGTTDGMQGAARWFDGTAGFVADDPLAQTLLLRDVTIRAVLNWDHAAQLAAGGEGVVFVRGRGDTPTQYIAYGLKLVAAIDANGARVGEPRWFWQDAQGVESVQPGGPFTMTTDAFVVFTATREWLGAERVLLRYWADARLLAEHEVSNGQIGGGIGGGCMIGACWQGAAYGAQYCGVMDEVEVFNHAMTTEEVQSAYRCLAVHRVQAEQALRDYHRVFDGKSHSRDSLDQQMVRVKAQAFCELYAAVEDQTRNGLPDRAYGQRLRSWESCFELHVEPDASIATRRLRALSALRREHGYSRPAIRRSLAPLLDADAGDLAIIELSNQLMDRFSAYPGELLWNIKAPTGNPPTIANERLTLSASALTDLRYNRNARNAQLVTAPVVAAESLHILATLRVDELADGVLTGVVLKNERDHAAWFGVLRHAGDLWLAAIEHRDARVTLQLLAKLPTLAPNGPRWLRVHHAASGSYRLQYSLSGPTTADLSHTVIELPGPIAPVHAGLSLVGIDPFTPADTSVEYTEFVLFTPRSTRPFYWYLYCPPSAGQVMDLKGAQAQLDRQGPAHALGSVITSIAARCDDIATQCDRTPLGGWLDPNA